MRLLIATALASIAFLALAGCQNQGYNVSANRETAQQWVNDVLPGYELTSFSSATLDTDEDGYISVDITVKKLAGPLKMIQLECPTRGIISLQKGGSCKLKMIPYNNEF